MIFKGENSLAFRLKDEFFSSIDESNDLEVPAPLLSLLATGVCHSSAPHSATNIVNLQVHLVIQGWETGTWHSKSLSASSVTAIYNKHMSLLGTLIDRKLGSYHRLMASLFASAQYGSLICIFPHLHSFDRANVGDEDDDLDEIIADIDFDVMED
jgi:hypothetical protein